MAGRRPRRPALQPRSELCVQRAWEAFSLKASHERLAAPDWEAELTRLLESARHSKHSVRAVADCIVARAACMCASGAVLAEFMRSDVAGTEKREALLYIAFEVLGRRGGCTNTVVLPEVQREWIQEVGTTTDPVKCWAPILCHVLAAGTWQAPEKLLRRAARMIDIWRDTHVLSESSCRLLQDIVRGVVDVPARPLAVMPPRSSSRSAHHRSHHGSSRRESKSERRSARRSSRRSRHRRQVPAAVIVSDDDEYSGTDSCGSGMWINSFHKLRDFGVWSGSSAVLQSWCVVRDRLPESRSSPTATTDEVEANGTVAVEVVTMATAHQSKPAARSGADSRQGSRQDSKQDIRQDSKQDIRQDSLQGSRQGSRQDSSQTAQRRAIKRPVPSVPLARMSGAVAATAKVKPVSAPPPQPMPTVRRVRIHRTQGGASSTAPKQSPALARSVPRHVAVHRSSLVRAGNTSRTGAARSARSEVRSTKLLASPGALCGANGGDANGSTSLQTGARSGAARAGRGGVGAVASGGAASERKGVLRIVWSRPPTRPGATNGGSQAAEVSTPSARSHTPTSARAGKLKLPDRKQTAPAAERRSLQDAPSEEAMARRIVRTVHVKRASTKRKRDNGDQGTGSRLNATAVLRSRLAIGALSRLREQASNDTKPKPRERKPAIRTSRQRKNSAASSITTRKKRAKRAQQKQGSK